jgi:hypothetical protein
MVTGAELIVGSYLIKEGIEFGSPYAQEAIKILVEHSKPALKEFFKKFSGWIITLNKIFLISINYLKMKMLSVRNWFHLNNLLLKKFKKAMKR